MSADWNDQVFTLKWTEWVNQTTGRKFSRQGASPLEAHSHALASVMESPGIQNLIQDAMKGMGGRDHGDE